MTACFYLCEQESAKTRLTNFRNLPERTIYIVQADLWRAGDKEVPGPVFHGGQIMKIESSSITMNSQHRATSSEYVETMSLETRDGEYMQKVQALADESGKSLVQSMRDYERQQKLDQKKQSEQNQMKSMLEYMDRMRKCREQNQFDISDETELQIKLLRKLLAALSGKGRMDPLELEQMRNSKVLDLRSSGIKQADMAAMIRGESSEGNNLSINAAAASGMQNALKAGTTVGGTVWHKITATSGFYAESEFTAFQSSGIVKTQDGRRIDFGVEVSMSRSFMEKIDVYTDQTYIKTDPLIINLDTNMASVSDVKFTFDLDNDGKSEEISFAGKGSGFLALDRDGDGKINNGSELFGTASGDGFADLAEYDDDGNLWIDENDSIFKDLRVWVRDSDGNDRLIDLESADVGAIYLGNASTEFSLKDDTHNTNGIIQKTGIYLKESGGVGTVNHVDLTM